MYYIMWSLYNMRALGSGSPLQLSGQGCYQEVLSDLRFAESRRSLHRLSAESCPSPKVRLG